MSRRIWYEIWIRDVITDQMQMCARVWSVGLTNIIYCHLLTLYDEGRIEIR